MELPKRRRIRLNGYDYSTANYYYVTICTHNKARLFRNGSFSLTQYGEIAEKELLRVSERFSEVQIDKYAVMPNHIHAVIVINAEQAKQPPALGTIIGLYKSGVSKQIHVVSPDLDVWQRSYYDHIIRGERDYLDIWRYIDENPTKWISDEYY